MRDSRSAPPRRRMPLSELEAYECIAFVGKSAARLRVARSHYLSRQTRNKASRRDSILVHIIHSRELASAVGRSGVPRKDKLGCGTGAIAWLELRNGAL